MDDKNENREIDWKHPNLLTARLNPNNNNAAERAALEYIAKAFEQGFNFKQIVVDAVNHRAGATPDMFKSDAPQLSGNFLQQFEAMFHDFAESLMKQIEAGTIHVGSDKQTKAAGLTAFTRQFSQGVLQRQQQVVSDDDVRYEDLED